MRADRPYMPDYPIEPGPAGLLSWEWAVERLAGSRYYWVATVRPDGAPSVTPVWGIWHDGAVWFSCGPTSRKARNLAADPRCVVTTGDPTEPVVVEGRAERRSDAETFAEHSNRKYAMDTPASFYAANALFRVRPEKVLGLAESEFTASPTRWLPGDIGSTP